MLYAQFHSNVCREECQLKKTAEQLIRIRCHRLSSRFFQMKKRHGKSPVTSTASYNYSPSSGNSSCPSSVSVSPVPMPNASRTRAETSATISG